MTRGQHSVWTAVVWGLGLLGILGTAGCQVEVGGQTLPSGYYLSDDVQYFAPGPEFKLAREAAAQKEFREGRPTAEKAP